MMYRSGKGIDIYVTDMSVVVAVIVVVKIVCYTVTTIPFRVSSGCYVA